MTFEGRILRGKANFEANILLDNADTLFYFSNKDYTKPIKEDKVDEKPLKEEIKPKSKRGKKNERNI